MEVDLGIVKHFHKKNNETIKIYTNEIVNEHSHPVYVVMKQHTPLTVKIYNAFTTSFLIWSLFNKITRNK
jgi:hypothetical protein